MDSNGLLQEDEVEEVEMPPDEGEDVVGRALSVAGAGEMRGPPSQFSPS